jgi:hypothetical protein
MTDANAAQRAQEWLERQLAELGQLRNASRRDQNFKAWRQNTLTVIQRIWPGDFRRMDRFRRIPFSPPMVRASERQVREYYERGWGEAGVLLREYLAEINLLGLSMAQAARADGSPETEPALEVLPPLGAPGAAEPDAKAATPPSRAGLAPEEPGSPAADDISRAMERLLSSSPVFRGMAAGPIPSAAVSAPDAGSPAAELVRLAGELEALGLSPAQASAAREALLALAHAPQSGAPDWELVRAALQHAAATPALAGRALPLLLGFVEKAA